MEQWKTILHYPDYAVSDLGRVQRLTPARKTYVGKILKPVLTARYFYVGLIRPDGVLKRLRIHRLVAEAFIPNPLNLSQVNHVNPKRRDDNSVDNLEWTTPQGNSDHANAHKLMNKPHPNLDHAYERGDGGGWIAKVCGRYLRTHKTKAAAIKAATDFKEQTFLR